MANARFSGFMTSFMAEEALSAAFPISKRRQVNVLKEEEFPLLAVWVDRGGEGGEEASDGEFADEVTYMALVAAVLGEDEAQDVVLGEMVKTVRDLAETFAVQSQPVEWDIGDWEADNNADEGDGSKVWAAFPITMQFTRPRGDY